MSSHSGAYSRLVSPAPWSLVGEEEVPEPAPRASVLSSSMTGGWKCGSPASVTCCSYTGIAGITRSSMNAWSRSRRSIVRVLISKSMAPR